MKVLQIYMQNSLRNFNYILYSEVNHKAIFIDPFDIDKTMPLAIAKGLKPSYLLNTHKHPDHTKDNQRFLKSANAVQLDLNDGEEFQLSERESLQAVFTPGHTKDHFCFLLSLDEKAHSFISGDTLFNAGVGNCKNGGDVDELYETIVKKIAPLPDNLTVYPGHDYILNNLSFAQTVEKENKTAARLLERRKKQNLDQEFITTTMGEEKQINPFLRLDKLRAEPENKDKSEKDIFLQLRAQRDKWKGV